MQQDVDRAVAAAEQARTTAAEFPRHAVATDLSKQSSAAADRASRAGRDAQLIVATAPDQKPPEGALAKAAREARRAADEAAKATIEIEGLPR